MGLVQKITPNLWFDNEAEDAAKFYTSIFKDSEIRKITYYGNAGHEMHGKTAGSVMTVEFQIEGMIFVALNGGQPYFEFNEAISFVVDCEDQSEVDYYWDKLSEGGDPQAQQCGWLRDKFGIFWQIIPNELNKLVTDPDVQKSQRVMNAMFAMKKIKIEELRRAYRG